MFLLYRLASQLDMMTLTCTRLETTQVSCEQQRSTFFGLVKQPPVTFSQVLDVNVRSRRGIDGEGDLTTDRWVALTTRDGEMTLVEGSIRINGVSGSAEEMNAIADQIRQFLQSNQPSLTLQRDLHLQLKPLMPVGAIAGLFVIFGLFVLFTTFQSVSFVFDKQSKQMIYCQHTLLGSKSRNYGLQSISSVHIKTVTGTDSDGTVFYELRTLPETVCNFALITRVGRDGLIEVERARDAINAFLKEA